MGKNTQDKNVSEKERTYAQQKREYTAKFLERRYGSEILYPLFCDTWDVLQKAVEERVFCRQYGKNHPLHRSTDCTIVPARYRILLLEMSAEASF